MNRVHGSEFKDITEIIRELLFRQRLKIVHIIRVIYDKFGWFRCLYT